MPYESYKVEIPPLTKNVPWLLKIVDRRGRQTDGRIANAKSHFSVTASTGERKICHGCSTLLTDSMHWCRKVKWRAVKSEHRQRKEVCEEVSSLTCSMKVGQWPNSWYVGQNDHQGRKMLNTFEIWQLLVISKAFFEKRFLTYISE